MTTVGHIIEAIEDYKPTLTVIDEGGLGYGILDRLNEQRYKVRGVNFGWKSKNPVMYLNKRAELWGEMRNWLRTASLPQDKSLKSDLTGVKTKPTSSPTTSWQTVSGISIISPPLASIVSWMVAADIKYFIRMKASRAFLPTVNRP